MKSIALAAAAMLLSAASLQARVNAGYYSSLDGISDPQTLKTAVYKLCSPHTHPESSSAYSSYYNNLPSMFEETDVVPAGEPNAGCYWDMYSSIRQSVWSGKVFNREHSFPKSWWGGSTSIPAYVDLYHLYPGEAKANQAKSNYPLGEVDLSDTPYFNNGVTTVGYAIAGQGGGAKYVFEPDDEYKGDFARTYFYMVTIYQDLTWNSSYMFMLQQNLWPTLKPWSYEMLLRWAAEDKVSQKELDRIEAVYGIQNNRNPFIDMPALADYIWGSKRGQTFRVEENFIGGGTEPGTEPVLYSPVEGMALDFGQTAVGASTQRSLLFSGANLKGSVSVALTGAARKQFSIEATSVAADRINSTGGTYLAVTYTPTEEAVHTANLTIFDVDGWSAGKSINVELRGEGMPRPTLSQLTVLPPSDVTPTSYVANWEPAPDGEIVDYYRVVRTTAIGGEVKEQSLIAEENRLEIDDYNPAATESYAVQSVRLGYYSPISASAYVTLGALDALFTTSDNATLQTSTPGAGELVVTLTGEHTGLRVIDPAGRVIVTIAEPARIESVILAPGLYFVVSDMHRIPERVIVR